MKVNRQSPTPFVEEQSRCARLRQPCKDSEQGKQVAHGGRVERQGQGSKGRLSTPKKGFKVCVCGGAGGIGQPLCLLMAMDPRVWELSVYDLTIAMVPAEGIGADLGHIERPCRVKAYSLDTTQKPVDHLESCLKGCSLVLVPVGVPSKGRSKRPRLQRVEAS
eukprot:Skav231510  [mRNA]  locus=scaffold84:233674:241718:- [translate_table: standard]